MHMFLPGYNVLIMGWEVVLKLRLAILLDKGGRRQKGALQIALIPGQTVEEDYCRVGERQTCIYDPFKYLLED